MRCEGMRSARLSEEAITEAGSRLRLADWTTLALRLQPGGFSAFLASLCVCWRDNPNWGKPILLVPQPVTEFGTEVTRLRLTMSECVTSAELKRWCAHNRNRVMFLNGSWSNGRCTSSSAIA